MNSAMAQNLANVCITVVIPLYNKERFVERALQSVMQQTSPAQQIVVIDDGSTDGSAAVAEALGKNRIELLRQNNSGPAAARNAGIAAARHEFVAFLDADDEWHPEFLQEIRALISAHGDPGIGIYSTLFVRDRVGERGPHVYQNRFTALDSFLSPCEYGYPVNSSCVVVPRAVLIENGGFNESQSMLEDVDLWIRITLRKRILRVNRVLVTIHYQDPHSITSGIKKRPYPLQIDSLMRHYRTPLHAIPDLRVREYARGAFYRYLRGMLRWGDLNEFDRHVGRTRWRLQQKLTLTLLRRLHWLIPKRTSMTKSQTPGRSTQMATTEMAPSGKPEAPIRLFEKMKWWVFPGINLHARQRFRLLPKKFLDPVAGVVLDAGCGNGMLTWQAYNAGHRAIGVTLKTKEAEGARRLFNRHLRIDPAKLEFLIHNLYDTEALIARYGAFDQIVCAEVIEHIVDHERICRAFFQLLKPGGTLHLTTPNAAHPYNAAHPLDLRESGGHVRAGYTPETFADLLQPIGFRIDEIEGFGGPIRQAFNARIKTVQSRFGAFAGIPLFLAALPLLWLDPKRPKVPFCYYVRAVKPEAERVLSSPS